MHALRHIRASKSLESRKKGLEKRKNVQGAENKMKIPVFDASDGVLNLKESTVANLKGFEELLERGEDADTMFGEEYLESLVPPPGEDETQEEQEFLIRNPTEYVNGLSTRNNTFLNVNRSIPSTTDLNSVVLDDIRTRRSYAELLQDMIDDPEYFDSPDTEDLDEFEAQVESLAIEIVKDPEQRGKPYYSKTNPEEVHGGVAAVLDDLPDEVSDDLPDEESNDSPENEESDELPESEAAQ